MKKKIMHIFNKVKEKKTLFFGSEKKIRFFSFAFFMCSSLFLSLSFSNINLSRVERFGNEITDITIHHTNNLGLSIGILEPKNHDDISIHPVDVMYLWDNIYREYKFNYFQGFNVDKKIDCSLKDYPFDKISFVYAHTFSNKFDSDKNVWVHEYLPFNLMFKGYHGWVNGRVTFVYITETQANSILMNLNKELTNENYESLLGTPLNFVIDNTDYVYTIGNIIYETGYYFDYCAEILGNFMLTYKESPLSLVRQECFVFNDNNYFNRFKIQYILDNYNEAEYNSFFSYNLLDQDSKVSFNFSEGLGDLYNKYGFNSFLFIIGCLLLVASLLLFRKLKYFDFKLFLFLFLLYQIPSLFMFVFRLLNIYIPITAAMIFPYFLLSLLLIILYFGVYRREKKTCE